jgi:predicted metal-dependent hydrolase
MNQQRFAFDDVGVAAHDPGPGRRTRRHASDRSELGPAARPNERLSLRPADRQAFDEGRPRVGAEPRDPARRNAAPRNAAPRNAAPREAAPRDVVPPLGTRLSPASGDLAFVRHPRAKRYLVRVNVDGTVRVTIPRWGSKRAGAAFAESQRAWIAKQRERAARERARPRPALPPEIAAAARHRARHELPVRLRELAERLGCPVSRISVRNQRSRWGSCSRAGHICLNWRLTLTPDWVRDYVLIHELMHLKRMDHSPKFWKLVEAACPDWREARGWLRNYESTMGN